VQVFLHGHAKKKSERKAMIEGKQGGRKSSERKERKDTCIS
jgi:hypothetical protein